MIMDNLIEAINIAASNKPLMGDKCNHCGWCCMTEVCPTGKEWGAGETIPCKFLIGEKLTDMHYDDTKHYCYLAISVEELKQDIGTNEGCCAETQEERLLKWIN